MLYCNLNNDMVSLQYEIVYVFSEMRIVYNDFEQVWQEYGFSPV